MKVIHGTKYFVYLPVYLTGGSSNLIWLNDKFHF